MLAASFGQVKGAIFSAVSLFCGIAAVMLIEGLLPEKEKKEFGGEICDEEKKTQASAQVGDIYGAYHCRAQSSGGACDLCFRA